jgi:hypothetical protein
MLLIEGNLIEGNLIEAAVTRKTQDGVLRLSDYSEIKSKNIFYRSNRTKNKYRQPRSHHLLNRRIKLFHFKWHPSGRIGQVKRNNKNRSH